MERLEVRGYEYRDVDPTEVLVAASPYVDVVEMGRITFLLTGEKYN
jgi:hypothetical protein